MCIEKSGDYKLKKGARGWKVFKLKKGKLYSSDDKGNYLASRPRGRWLQSREYATREIDDIGWHIFKKKKDAQSWKNHAPRWAHNDLDQEIVCGVKHRGLKHVGYQGIKDEYVEVFTADEILILPEGK